MHLTFQGAADFIINPIQVEDGPFTGIISNPVGEARFTREPQPLLEPGEEAIQSALEWEDVQALYGSDWLRLETKNESGGTRLKAPLTVNFGRLRGSGFRLALPDNSFFTPFDLSEPDRYRVADDDGQIFPRTQF